MRKIILIFLIAMVQTPCWVNAQASEIMAAVIITGHPDRPPFTYQNKDHIAGTFPELAAVVCSTLGIHYQNRYVGPWNRVLTLARQGEVDLIAGIYYKTERDAYLEYSESFFEDPTSVFVKKGSAITVSNRQDLLGLRGVTLFGDSFGEPLDRFIDDHLRMIRVYSLKDMFDHLLSEKADYMIFGYYAGRAAARQMGVKDQIVVAEKKLVVTNVYFAFSKKSPYVHRLPDVNRELRKLREQGYIEALIEADLDRYLLKAN